MDRQQLNIRLAIALNEWDPFGVGEGSYDPEVADSVQAVHDLSRPEELASRLQAIYEFSFEKIIPFAKCLAMAIKLLQMKEEQDSCAL
ncbi:DUF1871 family protein [Bacillus sp. T33-2]|uniref:DUF1871 family protein n=1 Tax=Bacillus sp. T33-2 TaxID=2054168 RepID=UPI000C762E4B|nr:DUF1871 family protein [Bacillus sp. T33-2]PLR92666.1 DUF1871 domain-containing protein [Bacillus sp. T33-2]